MTGTKRWYRKYRERILKEQQTYYLRNRLEKIRYQQDRWQDPAVRARHNLLRRERYAKDPTKRKLDYQLREARLRASGTITREQWQNLLKIYNYRCAYCGSPSPLGIDHIIPISKGGMNVVENAIPACKRCNVRKSDQLGLGFILKKLLQEGGRFLVPSPIFDPPSMLEMKEL